ncbi:MAG TPA: hypothetical protein VMI54_23230 [Polyangiaceae bacterium]|nr:hypothetical protein [Polyangiaceae bacterium]
MIDLLTRTAHEGYGPSSPADAAPTLSRLLEDGKARATLLFEAPNEQNDHARTLRALAVTGFIELGPARAWLELPPVHFVDALLERERMKTPLLLGAARVSAENASSGMALVFLAFALGPDFTDPSVGKHLALMHEGFRLFHEGYYCPLALHPAPQTPTARESLLGTGFQPAGDGKSVWFLDTTTLTNAPYHPLVVVLRKFPPKLAFTAGQREMLFRALLGYTDAEVAEDLFVSVETVRKRWRSIFQRVSDRADLGIFTADRVQSETTRGPEKRRRLLQYLASHLEEVRP